MSFADDLGAATYATKTTTVGAGIPSVFYSRRFLDLLTQDLVLYRFAQLHPLPEGNGTTIELTRPRPLSVATTALTEGVNPNASKLYFQKIQATLKEYGDWSQITSLAKQAHMFQDILNAVETFAAQAAETMDLLLNFEVCSNGIYPLAADLSSTSTYTGTFTTVTSTTSLADTALAANTNYGDANDDLNQSILTVLTGPAAGESRPVSDYVTSGGVITLAKALNMTPEVGDSFIVTTPDEITTADDLSYANLKTARTILKKYHSRPFGMGKFACIMSPDQAKNLQDDSDWKNVQTYKDRTRGIEDGSFGTFAGFRMYETTQPFAFPITTRGTNSTSYGPGLDGANYSASGAVQTALCFGKNAFAATGFRKKGSKVMRPPIKVKYPNKYDKFDVLDRTYAVGWVIEAVFKSLYAPHCVGIWTAAA